jgi:hypothetical protein
MLQIKYIIKYFLGQCKISQRQQQQSIAVHAVQQASRQAPSLE